MVSEKMQTLLNEINNQVKRDSKYIELVSTVGYMIELIEPDKRELFKNALDNAESMEDINELLSAIKLQIGLQGAKKHVLK